MVAASGQTDFEKNYSDKGSLWVHQMLEDGAPHPVVELEVETHSSFVVQRKVEQSIVKVTGLSSTC